MNHDVTKLQAALNLQAGNTLIVDGVFGQVTKNAMQAYEFIHDLTKSDQPTRELCTSLGIDLGPDFPYQPITRKPSIMESISMFPNIVRLALGLLPGLPDDVSKIGKAISELVTDASDHNAIEGLRDAARFARILADEADKVANTLDPSGAIQPTTPGPTK